MRKKASRPLDGSPFVFFGVTLSAQSDFLSSYGLHETATTLDIPSRWDPRTKQQRRVALADFSAAPWQGFEKSERGPNNSSLFQPQAAVVVVALG